jgi:PAS domain S-box-containing protein
MPFRRIYFLLKNSLFPLADNFCTDGLLQKIMSMNQVVDFFEQLFRDHSRLARWWHGAIRSKIPSHFEVELLERKKSEAKFMGLLESAPDAMVITNAHGVILMINAQTEKLFGFSRHEIVGKEVELLIPQRFHHRHIHHREGYVEKPNARSMGIGMDLYGTRKDGNEFPVEVSLSPMKIIGEEEIIVISAIRDISRQKETETQIKELNENLERLVEERTRELELALANEKASRITLKQQQQRLTLLAEASEVLSSSLHYSETLQNLAQKLTPGIADWCAIDEATDDGLIKRIAVSHVNAEKTRLVWELTQKYPINPHAKKGIYQVIRTRVPELYLHIQDDSLKAFAQDEDHLRLIRELGLRSAIIVPLLVRDKVYGVMTLVLAESERYYEETDLEFAKELARRATLAIENAKLYREAQDANMELEHRVARRTHELEAINKELESFSYSVSHDLRAPLRSIDGFSNKLLKDYGELFDAQGKDYFMRVKNASQHMGHLIDDLLKLARLSRMEMNVEVTDLSAIATSIVDELKAANPERETIISIQPEMMVRVDRNLMHIALQNLLGNAWKYSKNKAVTKIEFATTVHDRQTVYFVRDNGVGFSMKYVDKLFGAFQRLHSIAEFEGTGIGLATVQRIIHRHQGNIWAQGEVNEGATFFFTL